MSHNSFLFRRAWVALLLGLAGFAPRQLPRAAERQPVLLTTDIGAEMDDQWTLAHLALAPELELRGIVTTHSPSLPSAEQAARVARQGLAALPLAAQRRYAALPVLAGADEALTAQQVPRRNAGVELLLREARRYVAQAPGRRLPVLLTGAATDVASALLLDPALARRIEIIAMGFDAWPGGGDSWNVKNDPRAWQVVLASGVPITVGDARVTHRYLPMTRRRATTLLAGHGSCGTYLRGVLAAWLDRDPAFCRQVTGQPDTWIIWDEVVVAQLLHLTRTVAVPRPTLGADLSFGPGPPGARPLAWITAVDSARLWQHLGQALPPGGGD